MSDPTSVHEIQAKMLAALRNSEAIQKALDDAFAAGRSAASAEALAIVRGAWVSGAIRGRCEELIDALQAETRAESVEVPLQKPTIDQTAWVFQHLADNLMHSGSFRKVIYDRMGYGPEAYLPLYEAGGMALTNAAVYLEEWEQIQRAVLAHHGVSIAEDDHGGWKIETQDKALCENADTLERAIDMFTIAANKEASKDETATEEV